MRERSFQNSTMSAFRPYKVEQKWIGFEDWITIDEGQQSPLTTAFSGSTISDELVYRKREAKCLHNRVIAKLSPAGLTTMEMGWEQFGEAEKWTVTCNGPWDAPSGGSTPSGAIPWPGYPSTSWLVERYQALSPTLPEEVSQYLIKSANQLEEVITPQMSLINTLLELKDIPAMFTGPLRQCRSLRRAVKDGNLTLSNLLAAWQDLHLNFEFGILQFVRDVISAINALMNYRQDLEKAYANQGKVLRTHWSPSGLKALDVNLTTDLDPIDEVHYFWCSPSGQTIEKATARLVVNYKYSYRIVDVWGNPVLFQDAVPLALLDSLGVNLNPKTIWDAIPFSFLVDWFVGVGDWLGQFKRANLTAQCQILDASYSVKFNYTYRKRQRFDVYPWDDVHAPTKVCGADATVSAYNRYPFLPDKGWFVPSGTPLSDISWRKWLIGSSLLKSSKGQRR